MRLVGDLLDALGLQSTRAVLCAEASLTETEDRNQLQQTLKIDAGSAPVLQELVRMQMSGDAGSKMGTFGARKSNSGAPALGDASSSKTAPRDEEGAITSGRDTDSKPDGARSSGEVRSDGNSSAGASAANAGGKGGDTDDGEDEYGDDDYEDDDDFEDVASDGSDIALEIADDGLIEQSASFSDSFETSGSRSRGVAGSKVEDQSSDSLSMSTSIVHDSMDLSVQGSLALDQYDFVEVAQRPK